jgi:nucleotide-binding universal stress UspA family protein
MLTKILVPVDGSENSFRALDHALFLARATGAMLAAIHVIESPPTVYVESQKLLDQLLSNYKKESSKVLDKCEQIAEKSGVKIDTIVTEGDAGSNIIGYAQTGGFDLIVIGSRGLGRLKEMVLGSTSNKVLHNAKCPVMLVR